MCPPPRAPPLAAAAVSLSVGELAASPAGPRCTTTTTGRARSRVRRAVREVENLDMVLHKMGWKIVLLVRTTCCKRGGEPGHGAAQDGLEAQQQFGGCGFDGLDPLFLLSMRWGGRWKLLRTFAMVGPLSAGARCSGWFLLLRLRSPLCSSAMGWSPSLQFVCHGGGGEDEIQTSGPNSRLSQMLLDFSPRTFITSSLDGGLMDFSNGSALAPAPELWNQQSDNSSESNNTATGSTPKKARVQAASSSGQSILKVRKERLGDRITLPHQIVSPFGKGQTTDTASVLQATIGYI